MKIKRIKLYNFSSYEGNNELDFEVADKDKNIILIGGKNGAGKTSLFTAIKIALYGPLAYGYVGINPHYIAKVKDLINSKAFQQDKVEAEVQISLQLKIEREIRDYVITRRWSYTDKKLLEEYIVVKDGQILNEQELSYFDNYLKGVIPPDLFEFFLFDGEEVGNIFSTSAYNSYVKNAVFTLCGMDVFEVIRKYTKGYVSKNDIGNDDSVEMYEVARAELEQLEESKSELLETIEGLNLDLEELEVQLTELQTLFKNAGGISKKEKTQLESEFNDAEKVKVETLTNIKMFVEGLMPFYILRDFTHKIEEQMDFEEKAEIFYYVQQKISKADIRSVLSEDISEEKIEHLTEFLLDKFRPKGFSDSSEMMFDLSKEDIGRVNGMISAIDNFDKGSMIETVKKRKEAAEVTANINKILKNAMSEDEANGFAERENDILKKKEILVARLHEAERMLESVEEELASKEVVKERLLQTIKNNAQSKHVYELSSGLSNVMEQLIESKTESIRSKLEKVTARNLKTIYRKNNLITHIEVGKNFEFNLYQDEEYRLKEIQTLLKNLGVQEFSSLIGLNGAEKLKKQLDITEIAEISELDSSEKTIKLYKKIELNRLSRGERQIFILALYWAIIEISGQNIPFVIDTPYARIDANHRKEISEKFFPNISEQVIILSTDEEINNEYYGIIKPFISKEYLLINDENENKTSVENHYFFEV